MRWHDNQAFEPYLMQVLEKRESDASVNEAEVRAAIASKSDPLKCGLPWLAARFFDSFFRCYYMGAAEYEFGSIPAALQHLIDQPLVRKTFTVEAAKLPRSFFRGNAYYDTNAKELDSVKKAKAPGYTTRMKELKALIASGPTNDLVFHYIGPAEYVDHIPGLLQAMCEGKQRNKNGNHFGSLADPMSSSDRDMLGWLCVDYPFLLVTQQDAADAFFRVYSKEQ